MRPRLAGRPKRGGRVTTSNDSMVYAILCVVVMRAKRQLMLSLIVLSHTHVVVESLCCITKYLR